MTRWLAAPGVLLLLVLAPAGARAQTTLERIASPTPTPAVDTPPPSPADTSAPATASADEDRVWEKRDSGFKQTDVSVVAMSPSDPRQLVAGTARGFLYRSSDGGRTWVQSLRIARDRSTSSDEVEQATGGDTGEDLTDAQEQELEDLRQQTIDDLVEELTPLVGEDEAQREAEDQADDVVEERRAELQEENQSEREAAEADDTTFPPARVAGIRAVVFDPEFPGLVYAATKDGVWRSGDFGETWAQLPAGTGDAERDAICLAPSAGNQDRILVGTAAGLLVSADGGLSWSRATGELANLEIRALAVDPAHRNVVAAGTPNGAFLSVDGGDTFRRVYSGAGQSADVRALAFGPGEGADLYEGTANGLYVVTPEAAIPLGVGDFRSQAIRSVVVPVADPSMISVATARGVYRSTDGGKSFAEIYQGLETADVTTIAEDLESPKGLLAATRLGVYRLIPESLAIAVAPARVGGPSPIEIVREALRYHQLDGERLRSLMKDARRSPWLPQVRAEYRWNWVNDQTHDFLDVFDQQGTLIAIDPNGDNFAWNRNNQFTVTFTWSFDQLLGGSDRMRLTQELGLLGRERNRLLSRISRLARERRDIASRLAGAGGDENERTSLSIRLQELDAQIDAATGGLMTNSTSTTSRRH